MSERVGERERERECEKWIESAIVFILVRRMGTVLLVNLIYEFYDCEVNFFFIFIIFQVSSSLYHNMIHIFTLGHGETGLS